MEGKAGPLTRKTVPPEIPGSSSNVQLAYNPPLLPSLFSRKVSKNSPGESGHPSLHPKPVSSLKPLRRTDSLAWLPGNYWLDKQAFQNPEFR